jgi:copper chaperone
LDGVQQVDVDLASGEVNVQYDSEKVTVDALKNAVTEAGYDVNA